MSVSNLPIIDDQYLADLTDSASVTGRSRCDARVSEQFIRACGSQSNSYFALQPDCHHYLDTQRGFVPYVPIMLAGKRVNVVPTRPLASKNAMSHLLEDFEQNVPGQPLYVGVDRSLARTLADRGYDTTMMGTEFSVDLASFSLRGRAMKQLRHARNLNRRCPVQVVELTADQVNWRDVADISEAWRGHKAVKQRELGLLTRPPVFDDEWGVRKFYAYINNTLAGYVFFDPWFHEGKVQGYCANILRASPEMNQLGVLDYIILNAMEQFRNEGVSGLSLGIAPLHGVRRFPGDRAGLRRLQQWLYRYGNRLYAFAPLAYHKTRYRGQASPWFVCAKDLSSLRIVATLLKGTGVVPLP